MFLLTLSFFLKASISVASKELFNVNWGIIESDSTIAFAMTFLMFDNFVSSYSDDAAEGNSLFPVADFKFSVVIRLPMPEPSISVPPRLNPSSLAARVKTVPSS